MKIPRLLILLTALLIPVAARADQAMANQYLQHAINELQAAKVYVNKAKAQQPTNQRVVFHYDWVLADLNAIEGGIQQQFNRPKIQPRVIQPIKGDYIKLIGQGDS